MRKSFKGYRPIALLLSMLMFLSTAGVSMDMHFCQGNLKRVNFIGKAKTCTEIIQKQAACHSQSKCSKNKVECASNGNHTDCCKNEKIVLEYEYDATHTLENTKSTNLDFYASTTFVSIHGITIEPQSIPYLHYKPPKLIRYLPILLESFLL